MTEQHQQWILWDCLAINTLILLCACYMVDNLLPISLSADEGMTKASILTLMNSKPNLVVSLVVQYQGILPLEFTALLFNPHRVFPPIIFVQQCNGTLLRSDLVPENNVLADRRFDVLFHVVWSVSWLNIRQDPKCFTLFRPPSFDVPKPFPPPKCFDY